MKLTRLIFTGTEELRSRLELLGCDPGGIPFFLAKRETLTFLVKDVDTRAANALKQEMLSRGGDVAVHRHAIDRGVPRTDCLLFGTEKTLRLLAEKLKVMPYWGLSQIQEALEEELQPRGKRRHLTLPGGRVLAFEGRTKVMGILNVNADSFYSGSRVTGKEELLRRAAEMVAQGADILDIGAESTRPGSDGLPLSVELDRLIPAIEALREHFPDMPLSVDTNKAAVARAAVTAGADLINDISGLRFDAELAPAVADLGVPLVLMHIRGKPRTMQTDPRYDDLLPELVDYFEERLAFAVRSGIEREQIVIDPGIGFGKTVDHNLEILRHLEALKTFGLPLLIGHSRKSFIGQVLKEPEAENRLEGTLAVSALCARHGVEIVRVHDVAANRKVVDLIGAIGGS